MRVAYFDCFSGISGDMTLGALLACGADEEEFRRRLASLQVSGYNLHINRRKVEGLMSTDVDVELTETDQGHGRHLSDIAAIYRDSALSQSVQDKAYAIFSRLADAEAKVHGTTPDKIHFHEVGAIDSIVDITGACILLDMLEVESVCSTPLPLSRGFVDCQHGRMPLPAPATMELLIGLPTYPVTVKGELVTPTGAALIATLAEGRLGEAPIMVPRAVGYGAGKKDFGAPFPNLLRIIIGDTTDAPGIGTASESTPKSVVVLETNVDDAAPETLGYVQERLLARGALDVFFVAAQMKKNRPGTLVTVLSRPEDSEALTRLLFEETGTFGVRRTVAERDVLLRSTETVETPYGPVRIKVGRIDGGEPVVTAAPEFEDCRSAAMRHSAPLRSVYQAAAFAHSNGFGQQEPIAASLA